MEGPSRFAFPPHSRWRTLNVGNPPPQRLAEYMLVVTASVATAATDTAAATISSSQSVILIVFRIHPHTVWPRLPIRATHTGRFPSRRILVADSLTHLLFASTLSDLDCPALLVVWWLSNLSLPHLVLETLKRCYDRSCEG